MTRNEVQHERRDPDRERRDPARKIGHMAPCQRRNPGGRAESHTPSKEEQDANGPRSGAPAAVEPFKRRKRPGATRKLRLRSSVRVDHASELKPGGLGGGSSWRSGD